MAEGTEKRIPQFLDEGWWPLEQEGQAAFEEFRKEQAEDREIQAKAYAAVFGTQAGQMVLRDLMHICWFHPGFDATLGMDRATAMGIERDGMKKLVAFIQHMVKEGQGG